jgi:agmatinase
MKCYNNFNGFESSFAEAELGLIGLPFDGTASFRGGSRFAPQAVRHISKALETYSPYQDKDLIGKKICDFGNLDFNLGNTNKILSTIEERADYLLSNDKKIIACGGEHLVTYPLLKSYVKKYPDLHLIHFDAHTDLRDSFFGEELSHATVIKLVANFIHPKKIYQFGIRSGERDEFVWGRENTNFYPFQLTAIKDLQLSSTIPVYITLDLDVLDPAFFPGTGTPEPGGVSFNELLEALLCLKNLNIVGADVVELAPDYDNSGISSIAAAKLIREIALMMVS